MNWYILATISAVIFFGFVIWCVCRFGLRTCYSAYGPLCRDTYRFNWWSLFTFLAAFTLMPVILEVSAGKVWQFTGFLCTACIALIALTPDYDKDKGISAIHSALAMLGGLWSLLFIFINAPTLWWIPFAYLVVCTACTFIWGIKNWNFWLEMVAFLSTYTAVFLMI